MTRRTVPVRWAQLVAGALGVVLVAAGCRGAAPPVGMVDPDPGVSPADALADARALWAEAMVEDYVITYDVVCFCPSMSARVTVRDGRIADTRQLGEQDADPFTITDLFAIVGDAIERDAAEVRVSYHPADGHPTEVYIDYVANASDEEWGLNVATVTPVNG